MKHWRALVSLLCAIVLLTSAFSVGASAARILPSQQAEYEQEVLTSGDWDYTIGKESSWCWYYYSWHDKNWQGSEEIDAVICNYHGTDEKVTVPETLDGHRVTALEYFGECDTVKEVTVPKSVLYIGERCFSHCKNLTSVSLPESVVVAASALAPDVIDWQNWPAYYQYYHSITGEKSDRPIVFGSDATDTYSGDLLVTIGNAHNYDWSDPHDRAFGESVGWREDHVDEYGESDGYGMVIESVIREGTKNLAIGALSSNVSGVGGQANYSAVRITLPTTVSELREGVLAPMGDRKTVWEITFLNKDMKFTDDHDSPSVIPAVGDAKVIFVCYKGSTAENYAKAHGYTIRYLEPAAQETPGSTAAQETPGSTAAQEQPSGSPASPPSQTLSPKTGDETVVFPFVLLTVSLALAGLTCRRKLRKQEQE